MNPKPSSLPVGMTLEGDVEGDGDLVIHGRVAGCVRVSGALVLEATAEVRGDVHGETVTVRGTLVGNATAAEALWVEREGRVVGDLAGRRVTVVEGAAFRGRLYIGDQATRAPGVGGRRPSERQLVRSGREAPGPSELPQAAASRKPSPLRGLPRMPRVQRASGKRRPAL